MAGPGGDVGAPEEESQFGDEVEGLIAEGRRFGICVVHGARITASGDAGSLPAQRFRPSGSVWAPIHIRGKRFVMVDGGAFLSGRGSYRRDSCAIC